MSTGIGGSPTWMLPAAEKYGGSFLSEQAHNGAQASVLPSSGGPSLSDARGILDPNDPLFWVLAVAGLAVGLMFISTTVRVGPVSASVAAGKP